MSVAEDFDYFEDLWRRHRELQTALGSTPETDRAGLQTLAGRSIQLRARLLTVLQATGQDCEYARRWLERDAANLTYQRALESLAPSEETLQRLRPPPARANDPVVVATEADVDAFLELYPHAMAKDAGEEDEEEEDEMPPPRSRGNTQQHTATAALRPSTEPMDNPHTTRLPGMARSHPSADAPGLATGTPATTAHAAKNFYATMDYPVQPAPPQQPHQHQQQQPPPTSSDLSFQTAAEFARTADHSQRQPPPNHRQPPSTGYNPYLAHKPSGQVPGHTHSAHSLPAATSPPLPPAPVIRDSLRRKYQPPIRRNTNTPSEPSATGAPSGRLLHQRPSNPRQEPAHNDEELPEPLQRYGAELVQKICDEIMDSGEKITFDDIAGLADAKQTVQEVVCWPMKRPDLFTGLRRAPNGLLLFGPPGTGKTLIGKAIAHESGATFFSISSSSLTSKWIGEGEKLVRTLFAVAAYHEPSVVFVDEIDSLLTQRKADENEASRRIKTEFLVQLDGTGTGGQGRVLMIGATNRPQELDEAARRRFTKRLYIPLPEEQDREVLLRVLLSKNKHDLTAEEIQMLAKSTAGFSGADLKALCTDAAMGPIRALGARALDVDCNDVPAISYKHFRQSLRCMNPSVAPSDLVQYITWDEMYGNRRAEANDDTENGRN